MRTKPVKTAYVVVTLESPVLLPASAATAERYKSKMFYVGSVILAYPKRTETTFVGTLVAQYVPNTGEVFELERDSSASFELSNLLAVSDMSTVLVQRMGIDTAPNDVLPGPVLGITNHSTRFEPNKFECIACARPLHSGVCLNPTCERFDVPPVPA